ncbi:hypothetical protein BJX64DRAFT_288634 [Aspergillus heterothallicus]
MASHGLPPPLPPRRVPVERVSSTGLPDDDIHRLIAGFNKQVCHVETVPESQSQSPGCEEELDLNRVADEQFPPEKLQRTVERFYASVVAPARKLCRHVNKLRSWDDPMRTGAFCAVYVGAWLSDRLILVLTIGLLAMVFRPDVRVILFPPLPKSSSGRKSDSGAKTEVKEDYAESTFSLETTTEVAETDPADTTADILTADTLDPEVATILTENALGVKPKKKVHPALNRTMGTLSDITDICERVSNLLSPIPPFDPIIPRLRLGAILLSICIVSSFCSSYMLVKSCELLVGLALFGEPLFIQGMEFLHLNVPKWKEYLDVEKTLLCNIPTNAQLTLTLLRLAESTCTPLQTPSHALLRRENQALLLWQKIQKLRAKAPPPPPPLPPLPPPLPPRDSLDSPAPSTPSPPTPQNTEIATDPSPPRKLHSFLRFARRATRTAVKGHIALDRALATTASGYARGFLGVLDEASGRSNASSGRLRFLSLMPAGSGVDRGRMMRNAGVFEAKYNRRRGFVVVDVDVGGDLNGEPVGGGGRAGVVYFVEGKKPGKLGESARQSGEMVKFSIPVSGITGLQKTAGMGWKGRLVVELAVGREELGVGAEESSADGLVIRGRRPAEGEGDADADVDVDGDVQGDADEVVEYHLIGVMGRDALFNRLVAAGGQRWEMH